MAAPSVAEFQSTFPQFAAADYETPAGTWLADFATRYRQDRLGAAWNMAAYLHMAHMLTLYPPASVGDASDQGTARGPLTSEKVGDLSRSYGSAIKVDSVPVAWQHYLTTSYGQQLVGILSSRRATRARVVRTGTGA